MASEKRVSVNFDDKSFYDFLEKKADAKTRNNDGKGKNKSVSRFILQVLREKYAEEYFRSKRKLIFENERLFESDFQGMDTADMLKSYAGRDIMRKTFDTNRYKVIDSAESVRLTHKNGERAIVKKELKIYNLTDKYEFIWSFENHTFDDAYSLINFAKKKLVNYLRTVLSSKSKHSDGSVWDSEIVNDIVDGFADVNLLVVSKIKVSIVGVIGSTVQLAISVWYVIKRFPSHYAEADLFFRCIDFDNIQFKSFGMIAKGYYSMSKYHRLIYLDGFTEHLRSRGYFVGFLHRPRSEDEMRKYIDNFKKNKDVINIRGQFIKIFMSQAVVSIDEDSLKRHTRLGWDISKMQHSVGK